MEPLQTPPETSSFVLLADHQSRTPVSFHSGPPVLHYHGKRCQLLAVERDLRATALNAIRPETTNGDAPGEKEIVIEGVDVWVTSDKFLLYVPSSSAGVSIPYPSISLHAIQRLLLPGAGEAAEVQGLYMQIATPSAPGSIQEDEEEECITLTIVPPADAADSTSTDQLPESDKPETPTQMLYGAVSACSNLHPDPGVEDDDDDEEGGESSLLSAGLVGAGSTDGGLPPPVDGSSGWITAENMHEFFDPEGNWIGGGQEPTLPLGPGAGTVRERDGEEGGEGENGTGEGEESEETKWRRTD